MRHRKSLLERLEPRALPATISISDAFATEGDESLRFIDQFVPAGAEFVRPRQPTLGPDGNGDGIDDLYIASTDTDEVLRYDGSTGAFLDVFISQGSGSLDGPSDIEFGPDGKVYVSGFEGGMVLRFNGQTGEFLDEIARGLDGPLGLSLGSDGFLYIATRDSQVLKYHDNSGLSVFVSACRGGLNRARHAVFGPDANGDGEEDLYVASSLSQQVLRYNGMTGGFIDVFATTDGPAAWMEFGPDGDLYVGVAKNTDAEFVRFNIETGAVVDQFLVPTTSFWFTVDESNIVYNSNGNDSSILRHGPSSLAVFTVNLSAPSTSPITVEFQTMDGSALAGQDYVAKSDTLTFAPGQTTRTILVQTVDDAYREEDETFSVVLSSPSPGNTIARAVGTATILDFDTLLPPLPGDFNGNGVVEQGDLDLVLLSWGQAADDVPPTWNGAAVTGLVDQNELDAVLLNWGATFAAASAAPAQAPLFEARTNSATQFAKANRTAIAELVEPRKAPKTTQPPQLGDERFDKGVRQSVFARHGNWLSPAEFR